MYIISGKRIGQSGVAKYMKSHKSPQIKLARNITRETTEF